MSRSRVDAAVLRLLLWLCVAVGALVVLTARDDARLSVRVVLVAVAAGGLAEGLRWLHSRHGAPGGRLAPLVTSRTRAVRSSPPRLEGWENLVRVAVDDAHLVAVLRRRLADLAVAHLADRRGIDAARQPDGARAALGPAAWVLEPEPERASGERLRLAATLDQLEAL
ncbi:MAG: hypothetical protein ACRD29_02080 [Acidimicrobiales bacterium]